MNIQLRPQRTIAKPVQAAGFGYWSGKDITVHFLPAAENHGIVFVRQDIAGEPRIPADVSHRIEVPRRTTLSTSRGSVEMVEHVLAALAGLRIDNCEIRVDQAEMPGGDGSSGMFVEALDDAGIVSQAAERPVLRITEEIQVCDDEGWIRVFPAETAPFSIEYRLDYGRDTPIGKQSVQLEITPDSFRNELATARTFLLRSEAEWLRQQGLGKRVTSKDVLVFDEEGVMDNELRFPNECVRHKALDLVGDLALLQADIHGRVVAYKSGHRLNAQLVEVLLTEGQVVGGLRRSA